MERMQRKPQDLGICHRLFNFLIDNLFVQSLKRVTLGKPVDRGLLQSGNASRNRAVSAVEKNPIEEHRVHTNVNGLSKKSVDSLINIEFDPANGFNVVELASSIHGKEKGSKQTEERSLRIAVEGYTNDSQVDVQKDHGKDVSVPSKTVSCARGTKSDGAQEKNMHQRVRRNGAMKEKLALAAELKKDVKVRVQTPMLPIASSAFNIDKRSDELIRRTREALRNSSSVET